MAEPKGRFATQVNADMSDIIQTILAAGRYQGSVEGEEFAWQNNVVSRLTKPGSVYSLSSNENNVDNINQKIKLLETQHNLYIANHADKYQTGTHAYDTINETLLSYKKQRDDALDFHSQIQLIDELDNKSTEMYDVDMTDNDGNPIYQTDDSGNFITHTDVNGGEHYVPLTQKMSKWDELNYEIMNNTYIGESGMHIFSDKAIQLQQEIIEFNADVGTRIDNVFKKYSNWIGGADDNLMYDNKLQAMMNLHKEEKTALAMLDDSYNGEFIKNKGYWERYANAVDTYDWEEFHNANVEAKESMNNHINSLWQGAGKLSARYNQLNTYIYPVNDDGTFKLTTRVVNEETGEIIINPADYNKGVRQFSVPIVSSDGEPGPPQWLTSRDMKAMYLPEYREIVTNMVNIENQISEIAGPQRRTYLLGADRRLRNFDTFQDFLQGKPVQGLSLQQQEQQDAWKESVKLGFSATQDLPENKIIVTNKNTGKQEVVDKEPAFRIDLQNIRPSHKNHVPFSSLSENDKRKVLIHLRPKGLKNDQGGIIKWEKDTMNRPIATVYEGGESAKDFQLMTQEFNNLNIKQQSKLLNQNLIKNKYSPVIHDANLSLGDLLYHKNPIIKPVKGYTDAIQFVEED